MSTRNGFAEKSRNAIKFEDDVQLFSFLFDHKNFTCRRQDAFFSLFLEAMKMHSTAKKSAPSPSSEIEIPFAEQINLYTTSPAFVDLDDDDNELFYLSTASLVHMQCLLAAYASDQ